ncbi:MAG: hypothetical protein WA412_04020, partial [Candidatus Sulfotelmatobacter sp.]
MPSSYQVVLWKQESFVVLRPLQIEFFRSLLEFIAGLRGTLSVTFEEGTSAAWLHDLLKPH